MGALVTWVLSAVETLLCSMASGSIFFLIARLLTVIVSAFTDYGDMKGTLENSSPDTHSCSQATGARAAKVTPSMRKA